MLWGEIVGAWNVAARGDGDRLALRSSAGLVPLPVFALCSLSFVSSCRRLWSCLQAITVLACHQGLRRVIRSPSLETMDSEMPVLISSHKRENVCAMVSLVTATLQLQYVFITGRLTGILFMHQLFIDAVALMLIMGMR